ncbi:MAG: ATP-dependent DNA helicase RecG [bacterium]|nr:ATP-dependent DNA helicase RecG [bacterium]
MSLYDSIEILPHTSSITIKKLKSLGIIIFWDLLQYVPSRYENFSRIAPINTLQAGEKVTIIGTVVDSSFAITGRGLKMQKFTIQDNTGKIEASWFNQPYLLKLFRVGIQLAIAGEIKWFGRKLCILPNDYEVLPSLEYRTLKHVGRIVPVYSEKRGLSSKTTREKMWYAIQNTKPFIKEFLPKEIISYNHLFDEIKSYEEIHFPSSEQNAIDSYNRLSFDEFFITQYFSRLVKKEWENETVGTIFHIEKYRSKIDLFVSRLPFELTKDQQTVIEEIKIDFQKKHPMNRFLQGEVGSGKTVIAAIAAYIAYLNTYQSLIMAPTEILAQQHFDTFNNLINNKLIINKPNILLITSSNKPTSEQIKKADIIIGTHALIQKKLLYKKVGFIVIDEQHRFGVAQRAEIKSKGLNPHVLTMTATPIPRTVMLTLHGELDLSYIHELPKGRIPIKTFFVPKIKRTACYDWIINQVNTLKTQVFIVCPLIEESQSETMVSVKAATKEYEYLSKSVFKTLRIGLLHGKMKSKDKKEVMEQFKNKKYDILIATSVVEVGVDIPNATIMIIEGGERYGLAQLHQLRGRIGRGDKQSYCYIFSEQENEDIIKRLTYFSKNHNGANLAEYDLKIRGPGNIFGKEQHGYVALKIASLADFDLIEKSKKAVQYYIDHYSSIENKNLKERIQQQKVQQIAQD